MKLINPSVELIQETNPYKQIERIGRTCYKSEDKITDTSCYAFVRSLVASKHFAMLEHARATFRISNAARWEYELRNIPGLYVYYKLPANAHPMYVNVSLSHIYNPKWGQCAELFAVFKHLLETYIPENGGDGNFSRRSCTLNDEIEYIPPLLSLPYPDMYQMFTFHSIKFICDRGVSHELVRHRCAVAQESTRYCNYTKDKFGKEITYVYPSGYDDWMPTAKRLFVKTLRDSEATYKEMIELNMTPQQARAVLPNALKTECILTMNEEQWKHFFDLRSRGTTGAPHPDMKIVADMAQQLLRVRL